MRKESPALPLAIRQEEQEGDELVHDGDPLLGEDRTWHKSGTSPTRGLERLRRYSSSLRHGLLLAIVTEGAFTTNRLV